MDFLREHTLVFLCAILFQVTEFWCHLTIECMMREQNSWVLILINAEAWLFFPLQSIESSTGRLDTEK